MINVLLYCSYNGSAVGYQMSVVDLSEKSVRRARDREMPSIINQIWTHGGASAAAGCVDGNNYFLVKRIEYQNEAKQRDEMGRKIFMNCAFTSGDQAVLQNFANGFFAYYKVVIQKLGDLLVVDDSEIGYTIQDFDALDALISLCTTLGNKVSPKISVTEETISFIALEANWNYFAEQNKNLKVSCPRNVLNAKTYKEMMEKSRSAFPETKPMTEETDKKSGVVQNPAEIEKTIATEKSTETEKIVKIEKSNVVKEEHTDIDEKITSTIRRELESKNVKDNFNKQQFENRIAHVESELRHQNKQMKLAMAVIAVAAILVVLLRSGKIAAVVIAVAAVIIVLLLQRR